MDTPQYRKLLEEACMKEKEAYDFYMRTAGQMKDSFVRRVFTDIAAVEFKHFEQLRKLMQLDPCHLQFPAIENTEAMLDQTTVPPIHRNMSAEEALQLSIAMEKKSMDHYGKLAASSESFETKQLYIKLIEMENSHKCSFEKILQDIGTWKKK